MAYNPYDRRQQPPRLGEEGQVLQQIAEFLRQQRDMQQAQQQRLVEQAPGFDPRSYYRNLGPNAPYMSGTSAMQRYRDMMLRGKARQESARAAVDQVKAQQVAEQAAADKAQAETSAARDAAMKSGGEFVVDRGYGKGSATFKPRIGGARMGGMEGEQLKEFFQRAVNAGSPNARAIGMTPDPGYQGIPWNAPKPTIAAPVAPMVVAEAPVPAPVVEEVVAPVARPTMRPGIVSQLNRTAPAIQQPVPVNGPVEGFSPLEEGVLEGADAARSLFEMSALGRALQGARNVKGAVNSGLKGLTKKR